VPETAIFRKAKQWSGLGLAASGMTSAALLKADAIAARAAIILGADKNRLAENAVVRLTSLHGQSGQIGFKEEIHRRR
jgi:hypothetical protein